jgi:hypothetical protein
MVLGKKSKHDRQKIKIQISNPSKRETSRGDQSQEEALSREEQREDSNIQERILSEEQRAAARKG